MNFTISEERATLFIQLHNVKGKHHVQMKWIDPKGHIYFVYNAYTHPKVLAKYVPMWSYIHLLDQRKNIASGQWQVEVLIGGETMVTQSFLVLPS